MMKKGLLGFLIAIGGHALAQSQLSIDVFGTQIGLSNRHISCVAEDKNGYLWVGTHSGLNRFNGHDSKIFRSDINNPNSLWNNAITALDVDEHNTVWIGQSLDGLVSYNQSNGIFTRYPQITRTVTGIFADDSVVWFGVHRQGLGKLNVVTNKLQFFSLTNFINKDYSDFDKVNFNTVYVIKKDASGMLWLGTADGLYSFDPAKGLLRPHRLVPDTPGTYRSDYLVAMQYDKERNNIYVPAFDGVKVYHISTGIKEEYRFKQDLEEDNFLAGMVGIGWKNRNEIWLNSSNRGLISFNLDSKKFDLEIAKNIGLHPGIIYNSKDYLWICAGEGLVRLKAEGNLLAAHQIDYQSAAGISSIYADTILQKKFFAFDFAKYGLLVTDWKEQKIKPFKCKTISPNALCEIKNLFNIDEQYLLVLSSDFVQLFDKKKEIWIDVELPDQIKGAYYKGASPDFNRALRDRRNNIWITSPRSGAGLLDVKTRSITWFKHDPTNPKSIASNRVTDMIEDPWGRIWFSTAEEGVEIFDPEKSAFTNFNELNLAVKIPFKNIEALSIDEDSTVWLGSVTDGLYALNIGKAPFLKSIHVSVTVAELALGKNGLIWILEAGNVLPGYEGRLTVYNPKKALSKVFESNTSKNTFYSIINNYGDVIVGTSGGYYTINDTDHLFSEANEKPLVINSLKIDGEEVGFNPSGGSIRLPYNKNSILIEFSNIDFSSSLSSTHYFFKLEGLETQWNTASNFQRLATYPKLDPGNYIFKIKSGDLGFGETAEKELIHLQIEPPFWSTIWFLTLSFMFGVLLTYGGISYFIKRSVKEASLKQKLSNAQLVALRTQMNPHFIFNSLNAIQGLIIRSDVVKATQFTAKFSKLIRKVLENSEKQLVLLNEEIENLNLYLSVESIRFDGRFDYTIEYNEEILYLEIPSLVIQPVIENIIWQNLGQTNSVKRIAIRFFREFDKMYCTIKHNVDRGLIKSNLTLPEKAVGMKLTASRLAMISSGSKIIETDIVNESGEVSERLIKIVFDLKSISSSLKAARS